MIERERMCKTERGGGTHREERKTGGERERSHRERERAIAREKEKE